MPVLYYGEFIDNIFKIKTAKTYFNPGTFLFVMG